MGITLRLYSCDLHCGLQMQAAIQAAELQRLVPHSVTRLRGGRLQRIKRAFTGRDVVALLCRSGERNRRQATELGER